MRRVVLLLCFAAAGVAVAGDDAPRAAADLLAEADGAFHRRAYQEALGVYERAAARAHEEGAVETRTEALAQVARMHLIQDRGAEGRPFLEQAARLATPEAPLGWSRYLGVRGRFEWKDGDKSTATRTFEAMHAYCVEKELWSRAVDAAHMVAIVGTLEQQVAWGRRGIEAAEKGGMEGWLGPLWNNLGNTLLELERFDEALEAFRKARAYHWKGDVELPKLVADWAVGMACRRAGKLDEAARWMRPVLAWAERRLAEKPDDAERGEWVGLALKELGLLALARGDKEGARRDLARAKPLLEAAKMAAWDPAAWEELTDALRAAGG